MILPYFFFLLIGVRYQVVCFIVCLKLLPLLSGGASIFKRERYTHRVVTLHGDTARSRGGCSLLHTCLAVFASWWFRKGEKNKVLKLCWAEPVCETGLVTSAIKVEDPNARHLRIFPNDWFLLIQNSGYMKHQVQGARWQKKQWSSKRLNQGKDLNTHD